MQVGWRGRGWLLAVVSAALVAACSDGGRSASPAPLPGANAGGTLRVAIGVPGSIDPTNAYEPFGQLVVETMCESLLQQDPETGELTGELADSWQVTDSGAKMLVRLRKGLTFSDGADVTADDVVTTLSRLASEEYASFSQDLVSLIDGYREVSGRAEADEEDRRRLRGLRVIDPRSFEIRLRPDGAQAPGGQMGDYLGILTHPATSPLPASLIRSAPEQLESSPVCVGPYQLAKPWRGEDVIRLARSPKYPGNRSFSRDGRGWVDTIEFRIYPKASERIAAFIRGDVDLVGVPPASLEHLPAAVRGSLRTGPAPGIDFIGLPADAGSPWNRIEIRTGLSQALDRQTLASRVYAGSAEPATGFFPPALGDAWKRDQECANTPARPVAAGAAVATPLLRGKSLVLTYNDDGGHRAVMEEVKSQWERAFPGFRVRLRPVEWKRLLDDATDTSGIDTGFRMSWTPRYPGPDQYVGPLFTAAAVGRANWSRFVDEGLDTDLDRIARRAVDTTDRVVEYQRIEDELCASLPLIPLVSSRSSWLVSGAVEVAHGPVLARGTGRPILRELHRRSDG